MNISYSQILLTTVVFFGAVIFMVWAIRGRAVGRPGRRGWLWVAVPLVVVVSACDIGSGVAYVQDLTNRQMSPVGKQWSLIANRDRKQLQSFGAQYGEVSWQRDIATLREYSVVKNRVYVRSECETVSNGGVVPLCLGAIDGRDGSWIWQQRYDQIQLGVNDWGRMVVADDRIYVLGEKELTAFNARDGALLWKSRYMQSDKMQPAAFWADGSVVVIEYRGTDEQNRVMGQLVALRGVDGGLAWQDDKPVVGYVLNSMTAGDTLYQGMEPTQREQIVAGEKRLVARRMSDGGVEWSAEVPKEVKGVFASGEHVYVVSELQTGKSVMAVLDAKDGHMIWKYEPNDYKGIYEVLEVEGTTYASMTDVIGVFRASTGQQVRELHVRDWKDYRPSYGAIMIIGHVLFASVMPMRGVHWAPWGSPMNGLFPCWSHCATYGVVALDTLTSQQYWLSRVDGLDGMSGPVDGG